MFEKLEARNFFPPARPGRKSELWGGGGRGRQKKGRGGHLCRELPMRKHWPEVVLRCNQSVTVFKFWSKVHKELCGNSKFITEKVKG